MKANPRGYVTVNRVSIGFLKHLFSCKENVQNLQKQIKSNLLNKNTFKTVFFNHTNKPPTIILI